MMYVSMFGAFCVLCGFLILASSVMFVCKGHAVLSDTGAPNAIAWGKLRASFTSAVSLFVLGSAMIALPFLRLQRLEELTAQVPVMVTVKGKVDNSDGKSTRILLVARPQYDQSTSGKDIEWRMPLLADAASYSVLYIQDHALLSELGLSTKNITAGQELLLPTAEIDDDSHLADGSGKDLQVERISDEELHSLSIY